MRLLASYTRVQGYGNTSEPPADNQMHKDVEKQDWACHNEAPMREPVHIRPVVLVRVDVRKNVMHSIIAVEGTGGLTTHFNPLVCGLLTRRSQS